MDAFALPDSLSSASAAAEEGDLERLISLTSGGQEDRTWLTVDSHGNNWSSCQVIF